MKKKVVLLFLVWIFIVTFSYSQTISLISPHSGDTWYKGHSYTISWTKSGSMNVNVKIRLMQGGVKILGIVDSTANDGSYSWTIPDSLPSGNYQIRVKTIDNAVYDDGESFTITDTPQQIASITVTKPHSGQIWCIGKTYTISWAKSGNMNSNVKIRLMKNGTKIIGITDYTSNIGSYSWKVPASVANGSYYIRVKTIDNQVYNDSKVFAIQKCFPVNTPININSNINKQNVNVEKLRDFIVFGEQLVFLDWENKIVEYSVSIKNKGQKDAYNVPVKLEIYQRGNPGHIIKFFNYTYPLISKGVTEHFVRTYKLENIGTYDFTFRVNPNATIKEYKYSNNFAKRMTISREPLPDLRVYLMTIKAGIVSRSTIRVCVENNGQKASSPTKLKLYIQTKGTTSHDIPSIPSGHCYVAKRKEWFHSLKDVWVEMWIDPYNNIREDKERNNHYKIKLNISDF